MRAEFQIPSPIVETRESCFGRFCKQLAPYTWGIVDVSLEDLFPYPLPVGFRRKPSGCLIQASPNDLSKVTILITCSLHPPHKFKFLIDIYYPINGFFLQKNKLFIFSWTYLIF